MSAAKVTWSELLTIWCYILGDPGAVSRAGRKGATKVFKHGRKSPWVSSLTGPFPHGQANAGSWLGTKKCFVLLCPIGEHFSWVIFVSSYTTAIISPQLPGRLPSFPITKNEGTTDESKNVSDTISRSNSICTKKILLLMGNNVS